MNKKTKVCKDTFDWCFQKSGVIEVYFFCLLSYTRIQTEKVLYIYSIAIRQKNQDFQLPFLWHVSDIITLEFLKAPMVFGGSFETFF